MSLALCIIAIIAIAVAFLYGEMACFITFIVLMLILMVYELMQAKILEDDDVNFNWQEEEKKDE